jgi:hypothetical protein
MHDVLGVTPNRIIEVQDPHVAGLHDHDVVGLQICVNHIARMRVRQCGTNVSNDCPCEWPRNRRGLQPSHHAAQQLSLEKLHGKKIEVSVAIHFVDIHNAFMRKRLSAVEFASEVREQIPAIVGVPLPYFYRNISIFLGKIRAVAIQCFEHRALAAYPQALFQNVAVAYDATNPNGRWSTVLNGGI